MSDRLTSIYLPELGRGNGLAEWGRLSPDQMIKSIRERAEREKKIAETILAANPDEFRIETYVGPCVMKNLAVLQDGKS